MEWVYYFNMKKGFTLVEVMIVVLIVIILAVVMTSIFNSTGVFNKARDAQRKKDLGRIKVAFEEYFNDKGCYPDQALIDSLSLASNCNKAVFSPWLTNWPCDPNKTPYRIAIEDSRFGECNKWYKVLTQLENKLDSSIPSGWDYLTSFIIGEEITSEQVNYGVSSPNISWFDVYSNPECAAYGGCYYKPDPVGQPNVCNSAGTGCVGPNCYLGICKTSCQVACCGAGCN